MVKSDSGSDSGRICFINPAKSGSGRISQKQIRYSPISGMNSEWHACLASWKLYHGDDRMTVCELWTTQTNNTKIDKLCVISSSFWTVIFLHTIWASFSALALNLWPRSRPRALLSGPWPRPRTSGFGLGLKMSGLVNIPANHQPAPLRWKSLSPFSISITLKSTSWFILVLISLHHLFS